VQDFCCIVRLLDLDAEKKKIFLSLAREREQLLHYPNPVGVCRHKSAYYYYRGLTESVVVFPLGNGRFRLTNISKHREGALFKYSKQGFSERNHTKSRILPSTSLLVCAQQPDRFRYRLAGKPVM